jgi:hypothetical protein
MDLTNPPVKRIQMKNLKVESLAGAATLPNGKQTLVVNNSSDGPLTIELSVQAQQQILLALLATGTSDPTRKSFPVEGIGRFDAKGDIGIAFQLKPGIAVYFVLDQTVAATLRDSFDSERFANRSH